MKTNEGTYYVHYVQRGFTIVELLIVIVVIAILAGITIVAYAGITNRAQQSKIQGTATNVLGVTEAYNAEYGYYPPLAASGTGALALYNGSTKIPTGITIVKDASTEVISSASTPSTGAPTLAYTCFTICATSTGGRITYWDPINGLQAIYVGKAISAGPWAYPAT